MDVLSSCRSFLSFFFLKWKREKRKRMKVNEWTECNELNRSSWTPTYKIVERKILRERISARETTQNRPHAQSWRDLQQKVGLNQRSEHQAHWQEWDSPIRRWNALGLTRSISEGADRRAELKRAHLRHGAVESSWLINVEEAIWSCDDLIIWIASTVGLRSTVRSKVVGEFRTR